MTKEFKTEPKQEFKILCPFCNGEYTAQMFERLSYAEGCDTCGHGGGVFGTIDVTCDHCNRVVYRKEIEL